MTFLISPQYQPFTVSPVLHIPDLIKLVVFILLNKILWKAVVQLTKLKTLNHNSTRMADTNWSICKMTASKDHIGEIIYTVLFCILTIENSLNVSDIWFQKNKRPCSLKELKSSDALEQGSRPLADCCPNVDPFQQQNFNVLTDWTKHSKKKKHSWTN